MRSSPISRGVCWTESWGTARPSRRRSSAGERITSGSEGTPPALLLHGFTASAESWGARILEGLESAGVDARALDLPGHGSDVGRSDPAAFTLDATLAGIGGAVDGTFDLVGYSMGGRIALHQALRTPDRVRRLVLESASPGLEGTEERARRRADDGTLAREIVEGGVEAFVRRWEALPLFASQERLPPDVRARHRAGRLANDPHSLAAALHGLGTGALPSLWARLGDVAAPTLLVVGALDSKFVEIARGMERRLPDARLVVVPEAGHTVHLERPEAWLEAVARFLLPD